jgi:peptide chain release factor subunit 1
LIALYYLEEKTNVYRMAQNIHEKKWDSVGKYKLNKMLNDLSRITGHGTELVTVYIPPRRPIFEVIGQLRNEAGTASNIKSDLTRTHVQDALSRTVEHLKLFKETPENGIAIFCGAIPNNKGIGNERIELYPVLPPKPIQINLYRCDDHFWTDHIKDMLKDDRIIALLAIDTQEAGLGILSGDRWQVIDTLTSGVAGKHRQGGQSARRFERLRDNELNEYYHRVADHAYKVFIQQHKVNGMIVGGPGPTKDNFLKEEYLDYRLQNNIIATIDSSYSGDEGIREILEKVQEQGILTDYRLMEEKKLMKKFMTEVYSNKGLAIYGIHDVLGALRNGTVDTVIVNDEIQHVEIKIKCNRCNIERSNYVERKESLKAKQDSMSAACPNCGATDISALDIDIIDVLEELSQLTGAKLEVISSKTEEGTQLSSLGGIGAILRFAPR